MVWQTIDSSWQSSGKCSRNTSAVRPTNYFALNCLQVSALDFVVRSCPLGLKSVPAFGSISYDSRPFVEIDHLGRDRSEQVRTACRAADTVDVAAADALPSGRLLQPLSPLSSWRPTPAG